MKKQNLYKYLFLISLFYPLNSAKADDSNCYSNQYVGTVGDKCLEVMKGTGVPFKVFQSKLGYSRL